MKKGRNKGTMKETKEPTKEKGRNREIKEPTKEQRNKERS